MTSLARSVDVLIVGAGPVGMVVAIALARQGIGFLIVDGQGECQHTSRAAVIHAATVDALARLGVAGQMLAQGVEIPIFRIRNRDRVMTEIAFAETGMHPALIIPQDETEAILRDGLAALGHDILRPVRLTGFDVTPNGIRASLTDGQDAFDVVAKYLIGADGENSTVRQAAGIGFPGKTHGSFLLADVRMDWPHAQPEVSLFLSGAGQMVVAPMSRGRYRIVAQLADAPAHPAPGDVEHLLATRGPHAPVRVQEILWGSRFRVHHKLADRFRSGRIMLAGDAAHVHSPAGGQGMNLGIRDAEILGAVVAEAIRTGDETGLDRYAASRRKAASEVLAMTDRLTWVATSRNPAARLIRDAVVPMLGKLPAFRRFIGKELAGYGR